jgi:hypothetical protein
MLPDGMHAAPLSGFSSVTDSGIYLSEQIISTVLSPGITELTYTMYIQDIPVMTMAYTEDIIKTGTVSIDKTGGELTMMFMYLATNLLAKTKKGLRSK